MLFRGLLITSLSGSIDGITASRNRGGAYLRERTLPVDPNTLNQQVLRTAMASALAAWSTMTEAQRAAWNAYAASRTLPNRLGEQRTISGQAYWTRYYTFRYQTDATILSVGIPTDAPSHQSPGDFAIPPTVTLGDENDALIISWSGPTTWEATDADYFAVYVSTPRPATINWFRGPYLLVGARNGDNGTPITSPQEIELPPDRQPDAGEKIFVRIRMSRADYDLGHPHTFTLIGN
jgi:hypothetical protein